MDGKKELLRREIRRLAVLLGVVVCTVAGVSLWYAHSVLIGHSNRIFESYIARYPMLFLPSESRCDDIHADDAARYVRGDREQRKLRFSAARLNCLVAGVPDLRNVIRVTALDDASIRAMISVPFVYVNELRYLNGAATLGYEFQLGRLRVVLRELNVAGRPVPARFVRSVAYDFASVIYPDAFTGGQGIPEAREVMWHTASIEVKDGEVVLRGVH